MVARTFRFIIGISLALGLICFTLKSTGGNIWNEIIMAKKPLLLSSLLFYGVIFIVPMYRWNLLLKVQGMNLRAWDIIRLTMIGGFFNLVIPGAVSGDVIKAVIMAKQTKGKNTEALLTIVLDRAIGMFALFLFAGALVFAYYPVLADLRQEYRSIQIAATTIGLASILTVLGIVVLISPQIIANHARIRRLINYGTQKLPKAIISTLNRLSDALKLYRNNLSIITIAILLSILIHSFLAVNLFLVGLSVGENLLRLSDYFLAAQISNAVAIIPLTPGGIGIRDAGIALIFSALTAPSEKFGVIPVIMTLIIVFWRLIGGMIFAFTGVPRLSERSTVLTSQKKPLLRCLKVQ